MDCHETVHIYWHGIQPGTTGFPFVLEMVEYLRVRVVLWIVTLGALANLCACSQEITRHQKTREKEGIKLF